MDMNTENTGRLRSWLGLNIDKPVERFTNDELAVVEAISFYAKWAALNSKANDDGERIYWSNRYTAAVNEYTKRIKKIGRRDS